MLLFAGFSSIRYRTFCSVLKSTVVTQYLNLSTSFLAFARFGWCQLLESFALGSTGFGRLDRILWYWSQMQILRSILSSHLIWSLFMVCHGVWVPQLWTSSCCSARNLCQSWLTSLQACTQLLRSWRTPGDFALNSRANFKMLESIC